ncbi:hypothetical protein DFJ74DRAFT_671405 [Hyaloraphidium curvatum]|nr:hypothetical protein DFJ74DRAFT_671405 [Hyaloraphidium curvatum]
MAPPSKGAHQHTRAPPPPPLAAHLPSPAPHELDFVAALSEEELQGIEKLLATPTPQKEVEFTWPSKSKMADRKPELRRLQTGSSLSMLDAPHAAPGSAVTPGTEKTAAARRAQRALCFVLACMAGLLATAVVVGSSVELARWRQGATSAAIYDAAAAVAANREKLQASPGATTFSDCPTCLAPPELPKDFDGSFTVGEDPTEDDGDEDDHPKPTKSG